MFSCKNRKKIAPLKIVQHCIVDKSGTGWKMIESTSRQQRAICQAFRWSTCGAPSIRDFKRYSRLCFYVWIGFHNRGLFSWERCIIRCLAPTNTLIIQCIHVCIPDISKHQKRLFRDGIKMKKTVKTGGLGVRGPGRGLDSLSWETFGIFEKPNKIMELKLRQ